MTLSYKPIGILLVEDSETDRMLALDALRAAHLMNTVHCVSDGEEAMQFLRHEGKYRDAPRPDLILLDLNMPKKDGREVLAEVKADPLLRYIPVIVLTTSKADEDVLGAYGLHANCYITKPIDFEQFSRIATTLENFWVEVVTLPPADAITTLSRTLPAQPAKMQPAPLHEQDRSWRVLVVEDSPSDACLIEESLRESLLLRFETTVVSTVAKAESRLSLEEFDVVVADLGLPDSQGVETVRRLNRAAGAVPLVVLTMLNDESTGMDVLQHGATDYIVKGRISDQALARSLRYAIERRNIEEQLRMSQRMESIGVLASGVAHDFNNLLTIITGNAQLQIEGGFDAGRMRELAAQIVTASDRAGTLTRQLLAFSRHQRMRSVAADLNQIIGDFTKMLRRLLGPTIELELQLSASPLPFFGDVGMIEQIILNLAVNARDAMPAGGRLTLSTTEVEVTDAETDAKPGRYARLAVSDSGCGIPEHVLPHIFEPFFTTKDIGQGTGLGLSTVFGIVRQHLGLISVESQPQKGTTFIIRLPLDSQAKPVEEEAPVVAAPGGSETVLLVDDEPLIRDLAATVLRLRGYKVIVAESGSAALLLWPEIRDQVNLVLTDIAMPDGVSGTELAQRLKEDKPGLRVAYCSGYSSGKSAGQLDLKEGVNFLPKPYSVNALLDMVRSALDH